MLRLLIRVGIFLASCAIGLLVAVLVLDRMRIEFGSFLLVLVIFAILQAVLSPLTAKIVRRHAETLLGAIGLLSTFVALLITNLITPGLSIRGIGTWIGACLIVWLVTMLATMVLPLLVVKDKSLRPRAQKV